MELRLGHSRTQSLDRCLVTDKVAGAGRHKGSHDNATAGYIGPRRLAVAGHENVPLRACRQPQRSVSLRRTAVSFTTFTIA
jgi:hypothetical protein